MLCFAGGAELPWPDAEGYSSGHIASLVTATAAAKVLLLAVANCDLWLLAADWTNGGRPAGRPAGHQLGFTRKCLSNRIDYTVDTRHDIFVVCGHGTSNNSKTASKRGKTRKDVVLKKGLMLTLVTDGPN